MNGRRFFLISAWWGTPTGTRRLPLHIAKRSSEVDVVWLAVDNQGWHGFHACLFCLVNAALGLAEVDDLDIEAEAIQSLGDGALRGVRTAVLDADLTDLQVTARRSTSRQ